MSDLSSLNRPSTPINVDHHLISIAIVIVIVIETSIATAIAIDISIREKDQIQKRAALRARSGFYEK